MCDERLIFAVQPYLTTIIIIDNVGKLDDLINKGKEAAKARSASGATKEKRSGD